MTRAAFLAGFALGIVATFFVIARSIVTPERPRVPRDVYIDDLAAILERERW